MKHDDLIRFCEKTTAFDNNSKLKAILFASGAKPNTYVHLRITNNLHDKHKFEHLLRKHKIVFSVSRAKGFEEIIDVNAARATWDLAGVWYGYDLFRNDTAKKTFARAVSLIKAQNHRAADMLLGKHYGYPPCCVRGFIAEHDPKVIAKKHTAREYFGKLHAMDVAFPFLTHTPCSVSCPRSKAMNKKYEAAIKKNAPAFFKKYSTKRTYNTEVVVDEENDIVRFTKPDAHDYIVITMKPIEGHYRLISWMSREAYSRGTVIDATIQLRHDYALITSRKTVKKGTGFRHERHLTKR